MSLTPFALESEDVRKHFGNFPALRGVSLQVCRGEFYCLFGKNGAGKTTFLKVAATLMRPSHGRIYIEGIDIRKDPEQARRHLGFLSHNTYLYRDLSAVENLRFFGRLYGLGGAEDRIHHLIQRVGLAGRLHDPVRSFSRGLQQRLGIARALLHEPSVLLLDEPYTGLDANAVEILDGMLDEAVKAGKTIILTTHSLEQGLRAATQAGIIDRGAIVFTGRANDPAIRNAYSQFIRVGTQR